MPGVAHMASLKIVLERNKAQKKKMKMSAFETFMQNLVDGDRKGDSQWVAVPPPEQHLIVHAGVLLQLCAA